MSVQSLYTAATGMESLQTKLNVIANNMANVNTTGFKSDRANFEDLFYRNEIMPGAQDAASNFTPTGTHIGLGVRMQSTQTNFIQGAFQETGQPLDLAIEGNGFIQVTDPVTSQNLYTRAGNLSVNSQGQSGDWLGSNGPPRQSADSDSAGRDEHHDLVRWPRFVSAAGQYAASASRPASTGHVSESRRPAEAGRKPVRRHDRLRATPFKAIPACKAWASLRQGFLELRTSSRSAS